MWDSNTFIAPSHELIDYTCKIIFDKIKCIQKMVSSRNSNLLNRCTSKFINSSQIYPQIDHSKCDSMCNEEWSEVMHNLRKLPDGSYMKCSTCLSSFICIPWLLVTSGLNLGEASPVHFISKYICGAASCPGLWHFCCCSVLMTE